MTKQIAATLALLVLVVGGYFVWKNYNHAPSEVPVSIVTFSCEQGKTIGATFYQAKVDLVLSDGRKMTLPEAISASGARYANAGETFVFWNKGNTAFITEGKTEPQAQTYTNCVVPGGVDVGSKTSTYSYPPLGFSIKYPTGYTVNDSYSYDLGPVEAIPGIKFTVQESMTQGTNLSGDSGVSVEYFPNTDSCNASMFFFDKPAAATTTIGGTLYSVATAGGVGAGNVYEEKVYALAGQDPCIAVRYFIHYTQIANYPAGTRKEFDKAALVAEFDTIRNSLTLKSQTPVE